jgi:DNA invertase Pin-like site-specific DNA recombinase
MARSTQQTQANTAVLYLRVSTQEQATEGISLEAQDAKLRAYCTLRGLTIVKVIVEAGVSGGKPLADREGGNEVLTLVRRREVAHVVSYKLDRLFRDCADCLTVTAGWDKHGVSLHLVDLGGQTLDTSTAMGRFFLTVMAGAAELERNLIGERTREAMAYKRTKGERISRHVPYGSKLAADGTTLEPEPGEQAVIALARTLHAAGLSSRAIAARLAEQGCYSRVGTVFVPAAILAMVRER